MTEFEVNNGDLISFVEKCACKGVVVISSTEKITRYFFNYFYLNVLEDSIVVKAIDSEERRMFIRHTLNNVEVNEEGRFPITDAELLINVLKNIPSTRKINISLDNNELKIRTVDEGTYYGFGIRQANLDEDTLISLESSENGVADWDSYHSFDEEENCVRISMEGGTALYNTVVRFTKSELARVVRASVKLTKDQEVRLSMTEKEITFETGKKRDNIKNKIVYKKDISNPLDLNEIRINNLHPIVEHLFDNVVMYGRIAGGDGAFKYYLISEAGNIRLEFSSGSLPEE